MQMELLDNLENKIRLSWGLLKTLYWLIIAIEYDRLYFHLPVHRIDEHLTNSFIEYI